MTETEFADIIKSTKGIVLSAIEKHLADRFYYAIDDVVQETYIRAYRSLINNKFKGNSSIGTWLYTIARNESLRMGKKLTKEENKSQKIIEGIETRKYDVDNDFDDELYDLSEMIKKLPEKYRQVMELVYHGHTVKQIASSLQLETGTVKSRTSRGREILKKLLTEGEQ